MKNLVVLGSANIDKVLTLKSLPKPGQTLVANSYSKSFGGKGANQATAAARSGAKTSFIACLGLDGEDFYKQLQSEGMDLSHLARHECPSGFAHICVSEDGENCIAIFPGANARLSEAQVEGARALIEGSGALLMQLETPRASAFKAAQIAKNAGVLVALNPAPAKRLEQEFLALIDLITPNESELESLTGLAAASDESLKAAAKALHDLGPKIVLVTLGARGVFLSCKDEQKAQVLPSYKVLAIDTIGAGDAFNGAFLGEILRLMEAKGAKSNAALSFELLKEAASFAQAASALAVSKRGAIDALPNRAEIEDFLRAQGL